MGVTHSGDVFGRRPVFLSQNGLVDEFAGGGTDNVSSQDPIRGLVRQNFDKTVSFVVGFRPGIGHEGEFAHFVVHTLTLQLLLTLSHPTHFGVCVNYRWHAVVIDVDGASVDALYADNT